VAGTGSSSRSPAAGAAALEAVERQPSAWQIWRMRSARKLKLEAVPVAQPPSVAADALGSTNSSPTSFA
jgi:hypothetical protein